MVNEFLQYLQYEKNYSSHTVLSYHTDLLQFCDFLEVAPDNFIPSSVNSQFIQQWMLSLMSSGIAASTLSRKISTLKSFWRFLLKRAIVIHDPTLKIILPKTKKPIPAFFKDSEMAAILNDQFLPEGFELERDQLVLSVFYQTGIRLAELMNIEDGDVDLVEGSIRVIGKRNKQRIIPISKALCEDIERYIIERNKSVITQVSNLFVLKNGKKTYPNMLYNLVHYNMSQVSSLHKRSPHVLRHTFATSMLNGGADINAVKQLLGHSSLASTQVYTHTSFDEIYNIYKHAHPRAK